MGPHGVLKTGSFGSSLTIPPRKTLAAISKAAIAIAMGRVQPDKHISHPSRLTLCLGHHAHAPEALAGLLSQRADWLGTLSQAQAGPKARRAVSLKKSVGARHRQCCRPAGLCASPSQSGRRWLCHQGLCPPASRYASLIAIAGRPALRLRCHGSGITWASPACVCEGWWQFDLRRFCMSWAYM